MKSLLGVLVAISIPIFTSQLEKSKQATDAANVRAAYAEAVTNALDNSAGTGSATSEKMKSASWDKLTNLDKIGNLDISSISKSVGETVTISVDADGNVSAG